MKKIFKNKKIKMLSIYLIFVVIITGIILLEKSTEYIETVRQNNKKEANETFTSIVIDNQNVNDIKTLITITSSEGIEYVEKPEGVRINCNGKSKLDIDYSLKKNSAYIFKIKYSNTNEIKQEEIIANDNYLNEHAIKFDLIENGEGYKIIELTNKINLKGYNFIYKIGQNGEYKKYDGRFMIMDYNLTTENLVNSDETVTIYAKAQNTNSKNIVEIEKKYKVDITAKDVVFKADSLLAAMEKYDFTNGIFKIKVSDQIYSVKVYSFNTSQKWSYDMIFGTEADVATENEYAKNMVAVKVKGDLTINSGVKVTSYASSEGYGGPKGMLIYCTGTLKNNGKISMTARGAKAKGQNIYLWKNANNTFEYVPEVGALGGKSVTISNNKSCVVNNGENGVNRQTAGGSSGAAGPSGYRKSAISGAGGNGTSYSGGTGGGGAVNWITLADEQNGNNYGGIGGIGRLDGWSGGSYFAGGGAGNPGNKRSYSLAHGSGDYSGKGENGTGGLLIIYGNKILNNGEIYSHGSKGDILWRFYGK